MEVMLRVYTLGENMEEEDQEIPGGEILLLKWR
jgi:hypothetical protein